MIVGTVLSASHLPRAMIMAKSFKMNMPGSKVIVGILEEEMPLSALQYPHFDEVILLKNICMYPNYRKFFFQYGIEEAVSSSKAQVMNYIYDKYTDEQIILYMDSNMKIMSPCDELSTIAENHPIIISGHFINPESFDFEWLSILRESGIYNSGFLAFKGQIYNDIFNQYRAEMIELGQDAHDQMSWTYNSFSSGEKIADHARIVFSKNYYENPAIEDPFLLTNAFFEPDKAPDNGDMISIPHQPRKLRRKYNKVNRIKMRRVSRKKRNPIRKKRTRYGL